MEENGSFHTINERYDNKYLLYYLNSYSIELY